MSNTNRSFPWPSHGGCNMHYRVTSLPPSRPPSRDGHTSVILNPQLHLPAAPRYPPLPSEFKAAVLLRSKHPISTQTHNLSVFPSPPSTSYGAPGQLHFHRNAPKQRRL